MLRYIFNLCENLRYFTIFFVFLIVCIILLVFAFFLLSQFDFLKFRKLDYDRD